MLTFVSHSMILTFDIQAAFFSQYLKKAYLHALHFFSRPVNCYCTFLQLLAAFFSQYLKKAYLHALYFFSRPVNCYCTFLQLLYYRIIAISQSKLVFFPAFLHCRNKQWPLQSSKVVYFLLFMPLYILSRQIHFC